ncbi:MAG: undecaprenyl-diphosphate phosphatase [Candidatus Nanopelagicales bacterium]
MPQGWLSDRLSSLSWFEAVVLGVLQGLTEFLPISSSAHLFAVSQIFGWQDPGAAFTAVTQIGTEMAVLIYFRHDIARILVTWFRSLRHPELRSQIDAKMGWYVIVGTIPIVVLGLVFTEQIETIARNLWLTAAMLAGFGLLLGAADRWGRRTREISTLRAKDAVLLGSAQALALVPGVSRSGATITMGLTLGLTREAATRYAVLLAIPAVLGSGVYEATRISDDPDAAWGAIILATLISFCVGYLVISWLLRYIASNSYLPFVLYRLGFAAVLAILLTAGVLSA